MNEQKIQNSNQHIPVLISEILQFLPKISKNIIFDGTFGGGGYCKKFLDGGNTVYSCDLDGTIAISEEFSKNPKFNFENANFTDYINSFPDDFFDFIVLDLGYSSNQLAFSERGFSYNNPNEALDLRYNSSQGKSCLEKLLDCENAHEIAKVIYNFSGENLSFRIANAIFNYLSNLDRENKKVTVGEIKQIVEESIPKKFYNKKNAILSRVWQSLRIWTNSEFESLESFLKKAVNKIKPGGKIAIVCFHSLEDKIVTKFFRAISKKSSDEYGNSIESFKLLTKKAIVPSDTEISENIRSRSATLRVLEKANSKV